MIHIVDLRIWDCTSGEFSVSELNPRELLQIFRSFWLLSASGDNSRKAGAQWPKAYSCECYRLEAVTPDSLGST